jgi:kynureninase
MTNRLSCIERDLADPLAPLREQFVVGPIDDVQLIYLDGNSLGIPPRSVCGRLEQVVDDEWGRGLIRSWNTAGWIDLPRRVGDKIARLVGAGPGELIVTDSTSINLYKVLSAAITIVEGDPGSRRRIVSERHNFPSDLYIADTLARSHAMELVLVDEDEITANLDDRLAILLLAHVNYRTGRLHRMDDVTRAAHSVGALTVWDLAHSAGVVPIRLDGNGAVETAPDFAVGCGYKFLNGGPGAPAFAWVHPRHTAWMDREGWRQPLSGWMGHAAPFDFATDYVPGGGITRFLCGTPPILSLAALECGVDVVLATEAAGGLSAIRRKSIELTDLFIELVESRCRGHGLSLVSPRTAEERGSQVSFARETGGYAIVQALIERGVIGDFRAPDVLRFGFAPLYTRFVDVWDAVDRLRDVLASELWREPRFSVRATVT